MVNSKMSCKTINFEDLFWMPKFDISFTFNVYDEEQMIKWFCEQAKFTLSTSEKFYMHKIFKCFSYVLPHE